MTFQEAFTKHKKIVFHGHEKGYSCLFRWRKEQEEEWG
jgi:hypothetical protein